MQMPSAILQAPRETLPVHSLSFLNRSCNFRAVTTEEAFNKYIHDQLIDGIAFCHICQQLLENTTFDLQIAYDHAFSLEVV